MIYLAQFAENDGRKYIVITSFVDDDETYDDTKYIRLSKDVFDYFQSRISEYANGFHSGYYVESYKTEINNIDEIGFDEDSERTILDGIKRSYIENTYDITTNVYIKLSEAFMNLFNYNNKLFAEGIYVTEENKDEMYSKVLDSKNMVLIEAYLKYTDALESVNHYNNYFKNYNQYKDAINNSTTVEEVKSVYLELKSNYE